ncbi:MAG TPA: glycosyltransferase family 9 protein [Pseudolabrys sp.]|nr:glycosyltransferase family 9 protein [Pseudolabrys sp.]
MSKFAVIQVKQGIGDTIWHLPFVRAIASAAPDHRVSFFVPPRSHARELLAAEPAVSEVVYFAHHGNEIARAINIVRLARLLRRRRFRRIYILDRTTRPAFAAWLSGIPERIGIGLGAQRLWITNGGIDQKHFHAHPIGWLKALMQTEGLALPSTEPNLALPPNAFAEIDARFGDLPKPWVVLGLGASHPSKDWPDVHWCALLSKLEEIPTRRTTFLVGGQDCVARADNLIAASGSRAINACNLSILQCAALIKRANVFAGNDSGPLNIAAAVGTESYGLFGLTPALEYSRYIHVVRASDDSAVRTTMDQIKPDRLLSRLIPRLLAERVETRPSA